MTLMTATFIPRSGQKDRQRSCRFATGWGDVWPAFCKNLRPIRDDRDGKSMDA
jgi:hypothetical protein